VKVAISLAVGWGIRPPMSIDIRSNPLKSVGGNVGLD